jgi:hypothetical protein
MDRPSRHFYLLCVEITLCGQKKESFNFLFVLVWNLLYLLFLPPLTCFMAYCTCTHELHTSFCCLEQIHSSLFCLTAEVKWRVMKAALVSAAIWRICYQILLVFQKKVVFDMSHIPCVFFWFLHRLLEVELNSVLSITLTLHWKFFCDEFYTWSAAAKWCTEGGKISD